MGFGAVNRKLMTIRLCLSKVRLNNLLLLQINVPILTALDSNYESKLVDKTVDLYLKKTETLLLNKKQYKYSKISSNHFAVFMVSW